MLDQIFQALSIIRKRATPYPALRIALAKSACADFMDQMERGFSSIRQGIPMTQPGELSRRSFITRGVAGGLGCAYGRVALSDETRRSANEDKALVAITLDLEMSRNFPTRETIHWDYEKGNLNEETKRYTVEACRRVKARGGVLHSFVVGRALEQENIDWLKQIVQAGHPVGNHTYDHVNVLATRHEDVQFRFRRAPWLIEDRSVDAVIRENIRLTNKALRTRLGIEAAGFRTPGGFAEGLTTRPDIQKMLQELGFQWVSSKYRRHAMSQPGTEPGTDVFDSIVQAQREGQPFVYPTGLVEVPMSPVSDIGAFRNGQWKLDSFLKAVRQSLEWCLEQRAVFDFLAHPSCLYVTDPEFKTVDLICDLVDKAGERAALVDLGTIAQRAKR